MSNKCEKNCFGCEHFEIKYWPIKHVDTGLAVCKKHNLECDFLNKRQLNRLKCVEESE